ncbi:hypothetical protein KOR42_43430 [Thalassoglobus neptunius]|uniref:Uncharacterized protein n=1 Tax=Thalassoglobus neptunius TaxID=1938619 RepID=A0A5C5W652_9PLAN|nr:hypothetical protein KOR42_43430 [Thalassoglobus neptunius]
MDGSVVEHVRRNDGDSRTEVQTCLRLFNPIGNDTQIHRVEKVEKKLPNYPVEIR